MKILLSLLNLDLLNNILLNLELLDHILLNLDLLNHILLNLDVLNYILLNLVLLNQNKYPRLLATWKFFLKLWKASDDEFKKN